MNICKYCKNKNMNKEEYKNFVSYIKSTATNITATLKYNGGMYYNTSDLFSNIKVNDDIKIFIIQELKTMNIEFINNNNFYRVV